MIHFRAAIECNIFKFRAQEKIRERLVGFRKRELECFRSEDLNCAIYYKIELVAVVSVAADFVLIAIAPVLKLFAKFCYELATLKTHLCSWFRCSILQISKIGAFLKVDGELPNIFSGSIHLLST
jgi:hypothetical protein